MSSSPTRTIWSLIVASALLTACAPSDEAGESAATMEPMVVEVTAKDFDFELPRQIPSGWVTVRLENTGEQEHFLYVYRLPDDVTFQQFREEAMGAFGRVWNAYATGELDRAEAEAAFAEELPEYFFTDLTPSGGVALTEPGETAQSTLYLEPGTYVVECYVKTPQGTYHTERGMQKQLTVTEAASDAPEPQADARITLSNYEIALEGELGAGTRTVAVHVADTPEGFMAHDLNLIRLDEGTSLDEVVAWMDGMNLDQFRAPAPGYSLGGVEHMAAGKTAYMTVELVPGRYAWVSEAYGSRGMVREFTVE
ncbi:MAG: hypothetical protein P8Y21_14485 [Gemmatimonadales bacterium]